MTKGEMASYIAMAMGSYGQDIDDDDPRDLPVQITSRGRTLFITTEQGCQFTITVSKPRTAKRDVIDPGDFDDEGGKATGW